MKTKSIIWIVLITSAIMTSCTSSYIQLYRATPKDNISSNEGSLTYEDENCLITYNLWEEGGNVGFKFYNKTENDIILNMEKCFFISNGEAHNYFKDREFTQPRVFLTQPQVSYNEERYVRIPSKTSKTIAEYDITKSLYRDCDLLWYPRKNKKAVKSFSESSSPLIFSNRIVYNVEGSAAEKVFENGFYVSEISNHPKAELTGTRYDEFCGQKTTDKSTYYKNVSPDKFFISYRRTRPTWKH